MVGNACLRGKDLVENRATMFQDRAGSFVERCAEEASRSDARLWGNKVTTEIVGGLNKHNLYNAPPVDVLPVFFNQYLAGVKVIHILRDGRACVQSKLRRTNQSMESACEKWRYAVDIYQFLQTREDCHLLRYEDLLTSPETTMSSVLKFLGLSFHSELLSGTDSEKLLSVYRNPGIDPAKASNFDPAHPSTALIEEQLKACGYV